jgi:hypothetical protein
MPYSTAGPSPRTPAACCCGRWKPRPAFSGDSPLASSTTDPELVGLTVHELPPTHIFALVLGYEDFYDHDALCHDPLFAVLAGKAENLSKGGNPFFVVTLLSPEEFDARALYEDLYCTRGEMENRYPQPPGDPVVGHNRAGYTWWRRRVALPHTRSTRLRASNGNTFWNWRNADDAAV